ncbi:MAG TPA: hypothetical protein DEB73_00365 [Candidatus Magasanikbacteria bacterium]|uniref:Transcriptional regulator, AbiEi antitoxin, Type IV TA system n=1 Tax=Candidatus Magasanikbacteria bacterium GW2011_GWA2_41_55 TaxID=1619038 RepID=A0A0G0WK36_9BACT|nr:MAG: hypothetical protein UU69_C0011G0002 [Candidatus Magasanikbacteria bacterium GW2011_GWA2_41_55]HBV57722.1 hypothetical protein [Candidatus Magasanikbacteria bacterium]HBX16105.1 hypothetical protein [Candidatus Magasanikbacteria bacterium]
MRNSATPKIKHIYDLAKKMPYFGFDDLIGVETDQVYLKILFSRYAKAGKVVRLKKGLYVAKEYLDNLEKKGRLSAYIELVSNILYEPCYLSLDYILYKHNILTEMPVNFTLVSSRKTKTFTNIFGRFFYHKIRKELFCGFTATRKEGDFMILEATKAKSLFDFIYFRKNILSDKESVKELRLNLGDFTAKDKKELVSYIKIEKSKKMKIIINYLFS